MCMNCSGKSGKSSGAYTPKKGSFPKPIGAKKSTASKGFMNPSHNFGSPKVRMSFGRKY